MYDDDDDDDFATLGTPFAPLEADEIVSRKPEIDQTVRDERGRRRFHGAFTGGFSAGYWNTVGSAEGFTPKIFLSSRKNKYDQSLNAKPEDFMDDEDFGSFGIAPKRIHTKEDFVENSSFAGLRNVDLTFDDVIKSVFQPAKESIGKRLFRKMKRNAKIEQKDRRANVLGLDEEEPATKKQNEIQFEPKDNFHGLGYNGMLDPNNFLYADPTKSGKKGNDYVSATLSGGRRIKITGEAFGYGALEEDDNMAVYAKDDMSQYDFSIGSVQKAAKLKNKRIPFPNGNTIELEGFAQTSKRVNLFNDLRKDYKTPEFPRNWRPKRVGKAVKKSRWDAKSLQDSLESTGSSSNSATTTTTTKQQSMNANLRAVILGEEVVYKTGIAKRKQDDDKNFQPNELAFDKVLHSTADMKKPVQSELSSKQTPLSGFFASKFTRSSSFVEDSTISAGLSTFKDISSMPSFESRSKPVEDEENVNKKPTRITFEWHPHKLVCKRFGLQNPFPQYTDIVGIVSIDGSQKARNMTSTLLNTKSSSKAMFSGLFQNLTELNTFNPVISNSSKDEKSNVPSTTTTTKSERSSGPSRVSESIQNIKNNTPDKKEQSLEADIKVPRPPIDLFKSIFASDEEDGDDEENEEPHQTDKNIQKSDLIVTIDNRVNKEDSDGKEKSTLSKSGGIFSGVDFQQLNQNFNPCLKATTSQKPVDSTEQKLDESDESDDCYGPALPPSSVPVSVYNANKNLPKGVHSDVKEHRKSRKYKDKKKRKDKRKKDSKKSSKKSKDSKGRKRKRHTSGSSNSSQSSQSSPSEDVEGQLLELIKRARHGH